MRSKGCGMPRRKNRLHHKREIERERTFLVASSKFEHIAYNMRPIQRISTLWILCMVTTSGKKRLTSFSLGDIKTLKKIEKFLVFLVW